MNNKHNEKYALADFEEDRHCGKHRPSCLMTKLRLLETQARVRHLRWENEQLRRTNAVLKRSLEAIRKRKVIRFPNAA